MVEVEDEDRPHFGGLKFSDPILLGPEEAVEKAAASEEEDDDFKEIIHEFTWEHFPEGPKVKSHRFDTSISAILLQEQVDDLNNVLFAICEDLAENEKTKGSLTRKDIPCLRDEWKQSCKDILSGVP